MDDSAVLTDCFAEDYFAARERFLSLIPDRGWSLSSQRITALGPGGEPLWIDVATCEGSERSPSRTIIVSSGLHGVEGFLGSAVQCAMLKRLNPSAAASNPRIPLPRLVFVHALNPYGFAWIRRCNEDNVDLNRNFPVAGHEYRSAPADYALFHDLLNRPTPPSRWEPFGLYSLWAILRYGIPRLKQAIASGQYEYPQGLFFGGKGCCATTDFVRQQFGEWLGESASDVIQLDFHSGLGRWSEFELLADILPTPERAQQIRARLGGDIRSGAQSAGVSYEARGSIGEWCQTAAAERAYQYLCVEFGTYSPAKVLTALRAENRAQQWGRPGTSSWNWAKGLLKEAFCPRSRHWRQAVLARSVDLLTRAIS